MSSVADTAADAVFRWIPGAVLAGCVLYAGALSVHRTSRFAITVPFRLRRRLAMREYTRERRRDKALIDAVVAEGKVTVEQARKMRDRSRSLRAARLDERLHARSNHPAGAGR